VTRCVLIVIAVCFLPCTATSQNPTEITSTNGWEISAITSIVDSSIIRQPNGPTENWNAHLETGSFALDLSQGNFTTNIVLGLAPRDSTLQEFHVEWDDFFGYFGLSGMFGQFNATFGKKRIAMMQEVATPVDSLILISRSAVSDSLGNKDWLLQLTTTRGIVELSSEISLGIQEHGKAKEDSNSHRRTYFLAKVHLSHEVVLRAGLRIHTIDPLVFTAGISKQGMFAAEILRFNDITERNRTQYYALARHRLPRGLEIVGRYENIISRNKTTLGIGWRVKNGHKPDIRFMTNLVIMKGERLLISQILIRVP